MSRTKKQQKQESVPRKSKNKQGGTRGGKRAGSGRKGAVVPSKAQGVRLANEVWALRDAAASQLGLSKRAVMEQGIRELVQRHNVTTPPVAPTPLVAPTTKAVP
jgi:hypothetical protein